MLGVRWIVLIFVITDCCVSCDAFLNFYMNATETFRLLGIEGDLFYVRNGSVNEYALTFTLPIQPDVDYIYFNWQSLQTRPPKPMPYTLTISIDPDHLDPPQPSIPLVGDVPTKLSLFSIYLDCRAAFEEDINVKLSLDVAVFPNTNKTSINIRRRKTCHKYQDTSGGAWFTNVETSYNNTNNTDEEESQTPTKIFYISVGCACAVILLVAMAVAIYYVKSQKSTPAERYSDTSSSKGLTAQTTQSFLRPDTPNHSTTNSCNGYPVLRRGFSVSELKFSEVQNLLGEIHIERENVSLGEVLLEGMFGRVHHGKISQRTDDGLDEEKEVLIKTVAACRHDQVEVMLREGCLLRGLVCPNLLPVVASCLDDEGQPLLIYNYKDEANLKKFLQRCKTSESGPQPSLSTQQFVYLAIQVSRGLQYMHRQQVLHKDVACRNCVVDSHWVVRLTDNALSRDLFPNDYHCLGDNENRPVKWMSVEALNSHKYSTASDVWSFGVLIWELLMMGQQPYADIDPFEMGTYLQEGYRIAQPHNCPDELFAVMACCWAMTTEERPKIAQLQLCLQDFYQALGRFV